MKTAQRLVLSALLSVLAAMFVLHHFDVPMEPFEVVVFCVFCAFIGVSAMSVWLAASWRRSCSS